MLYCTVCLSVCLFVYIYYFLHEKKGFYSDFDVGPGPKLTELTIQSNYSAWLLSDNWNRPSQWLM
jgi:hypothetical protein